MTYSFLQSIRKKNQFHELLGLFSHSDPTNVLEMLKMSLDNTSQMNLLWVTIDYEKYHQVRHIIELNNNNNNRLTHGCKAHLGRNNYSTTVYYGFKTTKHQRHELQT